MPPINPAEALLDALADGCVRQRRSCVLPSPCLPPYLFANSEVDGFSLCSVNGLLTTFRGGSEPALEPTPRRVGFQEPPKPSGPLTLSDLKGLSTKRTELEVLIEKGEKALEQLEPSERGTSTLLLDLASLYQQDEQLVDAQARCLSCAQILILHSATAPVTHALKPLVAPLLQSFCCAAQALFQQSLDSRKAALGEFDPSTLASQHGLGALMAERGELAEASPVLVEVMASRRTVLGDTHADTLASISANAALARRRGDLALSTTLYAEAMASYRATLGPKHTTTLETVNALAAVYLARGERDEAATLLADALPVSLVKELGRGHKVTAQYAANVKQVRRARMRFGV